MVVAVALPSLETLKSKYSYNTMNKNSDSLHFFLIGMPIVGPVICNHDKNSLKYVFLKKSLMLSFEFKSTAIKLAGPVLIFALTDSRQTYTLTHFCEFFATDNQILNQDLRRRVYFIFLGKTHFPSFISLRMQQPTEAQAEAYLGQLRQQMQQQMMQVRTLLLSQV